MALVLVRHSERPELWDRIPERFAGVVPEYNLHGDINGDYWNRLFDDFPEFQFVLYDDEHDTIVGSRPLAAPDLGRHRGGPRSGPGRLDRAGLRGPRRRARPGRAVRAGHRGRGGPSGPGAVQGAARRDVGHGTARRSRDGPGTGASHLEGAVSTGADRAVRGVDPGRRHPVRPVDPDPGGRGRHPRGGVRAFLPDHGNGRRVGELDGPRLPGGRGVRLPRWSRTAPGRPGAGSGRVLGTGSVDHAPGRRPAALT